MEFLHHTSIRYTRDELKERRLSDWRDRLTGRVTSSLTGDALKAASDLIAPGAPQNKDREGKEALLGLSASERMEVWKVVFPNLCREVEQTWVHLPPEVIHQRDGGYSGNGTRLRFEPTPIENSNRFNEWVRKLVLISGPFPELDLAGLLAIAESFCYGLRWPHDRDAPAYAAVAVLNQGGELAEPVWEVLRQIVDGTHQTGVMGRHIRTALLCSEIPEAWALLDDALVNARMDDGFRSELVTDRVGIHPGAWVHFLKTIREHKLLRFEGIRESVESQLGLFSYDNRWRFKDRKERDELFEQIVRVHEDVTVRSESLAGDSSIHAFFALYAMGTENAESSIQKAGEMLENRSEAGKIAAAWFLGRADGPLAIGSLRKGVGPENLLVSSIIAEHATRLFSPCPESYERICQLLERIDAESEASQIEIPHPWPEVRMDRNIFCCWLAQSLPTGEEERIEPWLCRMGKEARNLVVTRLNRLEQSQGMRRILAQMMRDQDTDVAEHATKALWSEPLSPSELGIAEGVLELKSAKRRDVVFQLLMKQPDSALDESIRSLLKSQKSAQRLGGLELIRRLCGKDEAKDKARMLYEGWKRPKKISKDEVTQIEAIDATFADRIPEEPSASDWCLANAFGLVDPGMLPVFEPPVPPDDVLLHSPVTVKLLEQMVEIYHNQVGSEFQKAHWNGTFETVVLGEERFPYFPYGKTFDQAKESFPLIGFWEEWWESRPIACRDDDRFELERLRMLVQCMDKRFSSESISLFFGFPAFPSVGSRKYDLENILAWLMRKFRSERWRDYYVNAAAHAYQKEKHLKDKDKYVAGWWFSEAVSSSLDLWHIDQIEPELSKKTWQILSLRDPDRKDCLYGTSAIAAFAQGVATREELIWHYIGRRDLDQVPRNRWSHQFEVRGLANPQSKIVKDFPQVRDIGQQCIVHLLGVELQRGEKITEATLILKTVDYFTDAFQLVRILNALGSGKLQRTRNSEDGSRESVFTHLISVCHPGEEDTPQEFARLVKKSEIPIHRLIEISVFAPQWTEFVDSALEIGGLKEAVGWIHAHTKTSEWSWTAKSRELWAGELSRITPLTAEQLLDGAVDVAWFHRARKSVGDDIWSQLYEAAKFASSAAGHTRARLYSDALLSKVSRKDIISRIKDKRHQDSVRALGLLPLPTEGPQREKELLTRYRALSDFKALARKAKAQRRASEMMAWQIGLDNLARNAGYDNPPRFQWSMEAAAVAELKDDSLEASLDGVTARIEVTPWGKVEIAAERDGKPLKSIPAKLRKTPAFLRLREKQDGFREQVSRLRPELEEMMINQTCLPASEWQAFLQHPLVEPMLRKLVLASSRGPVGFPTREGVVSATGKKTPWPKSLLGLAHPHDFIASGTWSDWQKHCVRHEIVQPFKQVFREYYCPVCDEKESTTRFAGHWVKINQAFAMLGPRGWIHHPDDGLHRVFHRAGIIAWLRFEEFFYHPRELEEATVSEIYFKKKDGGSIVNAEEVPPLIFSEVLRDVDLVVSVAHATGYDPETTQSSVEIRAALVSTVCELLRRETVKVEDNKVLVSGKRANYRIHLGSGVVHQEGRKMLRIYTDPAPGRGRLFLPFADDDPKTAEILSKVLWLSEDEKIRDPGFLKQIESN